MSLIKKDEKNIIWGFKKIRNKNKYFPMTGGDYDRVIQSLHRTYIRFFLGYCVYMGYGRNDIKNLFSCNMADFDVLLKHGMDFEQIPEESEMETQWRS